MTSSLVLTMRRSFAPCSTAAMFDLSELMTVYGLYPVEAERGQSQTNELLHASKCRLIAAVRPCAAGRLWTNLRICGASSDLDSCHLVGRRQTFVGLNLLLSSLQQPSPGIALKMSRNNTAGTANKGRLPPALLDLCALGFLQRHADLCSRY